ncbi:MAG: GrpB family protein [Armatimonadetes bacterium]|nr:GrpB family protein [Armatimonadota bacterium]
MDEIEIVSYDPRWPALFVAEAARIHAAVGGQLVALEHFGSTAVPGLSAKPVIDILVAVRSLVQARQEAVPALEALGYSYWRDNPDPHHMFFVKGLPPHGPRTHHVHLVEVGSPDARLTGEDTFRDRLLFRDYLRAHPEEARRYEALKRDLAARFTTDREAYTDSKTDYVRSVMVRARRETKTRKTSTQKPDKFTWFPREDV